MKCPKTLQIEITEDDQIKLVGADCIEEKCAGWVRRTRDEDGVVYEGCYRFVLVDILDEICRKMPHAGQFAKKP